VAEKRKEEQDRIKEIERIEKAKIAKQKSEYLERVRVQNDFRAEE